MNKIWILFKREYKAAVKTKGFIITLIIVPIMMGGSFVVMMLTDDNQDIDDKHIVVMDYSGEVNELLTEASQERNETGIFNQETGEQVEPKYILEFVEPDLENPFEQQLELSDRIRSKELIAFVEVGKNVMAPGPDTEEDFIKYYSEHSFMDNMRYWFSDVIGNYSRQKRIEALNLDPELTKGLFDWVNIEGMGLVDVDKKTGEQQAAEKSNEFQSFIVPYIFVMLMFMMTMMSAAPLLTSVMEEKNEKIAEVLLGTITPFEFMMGKVFGGLGVSLTTAAVYIAGGVMIASNAGYASLISTNLLIWFFVYVIFFVIMVGSGMAALGSTCNDNKDAQSLQFPAMLPIILPLFVIVPIIQNPTGSLATTLSFIPPFTPTIMMVRMATPVSIPIWQPVLGLALVILFTVFTVWLGARIFRTAILIQGQKPSFNNLIKYAFKG